MAEIQIYSANQLQAREWRELQSIQRESFLATLQRTPDEIAYLVDWDDPDRYRLAHEDPNTEVGKRFRSNQEFSEPRVAIALEDSAPIGYLYAANNVSGSKAERMIKKLGVTKKYLWLREVAVRPDLQREGIASALGRSILEAAISHQPVTAYIWPTEIPFLQYKLEEFGFADTGSQEVDLFGNNIMIEQIRMQAPSVKQVLLHLNQLPDSY